MSPTFDEITIGQSTDYTRTITEADIEKFADVSGDHNPVHMDEDFAKTTMFKGRIAHGLLSASFISTILASKLPGPGTIYLSQELKFLRPVRISDIITVEVKVLEKNSEKKRVILSTTCKNQDGKKVIDGKAEVMIN